MGSVLFTQLGLGTATVAVTVLTHLLGLSGLIALMRLHTRRLMTAKARFNQAAILVGAAFGLFALHTLEI